MQFFKNKYFFEEYPTPSLLFELNSLEIKAVNNAALSLYGYNREEMLLLTIKDLRPEEEVPKLIRFLTWQSQNQKGKNSVFSGTMNLSPILTCHGLTHRDLCR